jgi:hypothetical protein
MMNHSSVLVVSSLVVFKVASMDGSCGRYAAHINIQEAARSETLECLEDAMRGSSKSA